MKKKILIMVIALFSCFSLITNLQAKQQAYNCYYSSKKEDIQVTFRLRIKNKSTVAETAKLSGKDVDTILWFKNNDEDVKNWSNTFFKKITFKGATYYNKNRVCPPYALLSDSTGIFDGGYNLFVSDKKNLDDIKAAIKDEYSTLKSGFPKILYVTKQQEEVEKDEPTSCLDFGKKSSGKFKGTCENNNYFACIWNETEYGGYCNVDKLQYVKCGNANNIPKEIPSITSFLVNLLKIVTPIVLIIVSIITLVKALAASKEDEIKKAQSSLIKKLIAAVLVFFIVYIVQFVILKVADSSEEGSITSCFSCFINNDCSDNIYYKTNASGIDICTYLDGSDFENCGR